MKNINSYKDLLVWQKSMDMVTEVYKITRQLPKEEVYGLSAQLRRCSISIPSNIAEGYGRNSTKDYIRFLQIACCSLYELQTQLQICLNLSYIPNEAFAFLSVKGVEMEKMLNSLIYKIKRSRP